MNSPSLFTIGYSGWTTEAFVQRLKQAGVQTVVDVRELPLSRKRGFSKNSLRSILNSQGMAYVHLRELGVPAQLRAKLRKGLTIADYLKAFREYLQDRAGTLSSLCAMAREQVCCLMCVEKNVAECHRSVIAQALLSQDRRSIEVNHL